MNCKTKKIINVFLTILSLAVCPPLFASGAIRAYQGSHGDALFVDSSDGQAIMIAGGAVPNGAATASDCFAEAYVSLKKAPNYYEGVFIPVFNEISHVTKEEIHDQGIGLYLSSDKLKIGGAEISGICADGIDFSGNYKEIFKGSREYQRKFLYFMNLAHQNSNYLFEHRDIKAALAGLKPFVENYVPDWLADSSSEKILIPAINDYAFVLQSSGKNADALPFLQLVTRYQPTRTVAWLNIGDAYWAEGHMDDARKSYTEYVRQMTAAGMASKIPARALQREKK